MVSRVVLLMSVGFMGFVGWSNAALAGPGGVVVVVGADSPIDNLSARELKQLFLAKRTQLSQGGKAVTFTPKAGSPARVAFDKAILGLEPEEAARYWIDRKIRGMSGRPRAFPSAKTLMLVIAKIPGGLGYVLESDLDASLGVKAITIDGKPHSHPSYPLAD